MAKVPSFPHSNSLQILGHGLPAVCAGVGGGSRATCGRAQASNRAATAAQQGAAEGSRAYALARRRHARRRRARARLRLRDVYSGAPCGRQHLYKLRERKAPLERSARLRICEDAKKQNMENQLSANAHTPAPEHASAQQESPDVAVEASAHTRLMRAVEASTYATFRTHILVSAHVEIAAQSRRKAVPFLGPFFGPKNGTVFRSRFRGNI